MGNSSSTNDSKKTNDIKPIPPTNEVNNAKELIEKTINPKLDLENEDTDKIVETLADMTEIKKVNLKQDKTEPIEQVGGKKKIPMIGGNNNYMNLSETSDNVLNGFQNKSGRKRYTKYDLFKILRDLDIETEVQEGGANMGVGAGAGAGAGAESNVESSLNDDESMEHIKNIILKELATLRDNKSKQVGGTGCGCSGSADSVEKNSKKLSSKLNMKKIIIDDNSKQLGGAVVIDDSSSTSSSSDDSDSSSSEMGKSKASKSKASKSKSVYAKQSENSESEANSNFYIETSESGIGINNTETSNGDDNKKNTENDEDEDEDEDEDKHKVQSDESEEGLSIFPFNSSDVKSSRSIRNYRMLRRKI